MSPVRAAVRTLLDLLKAVGLWLLWQIPLWGAIGGGVDMALIAMLVLAWAFVRVYSGPGLVSRRFRATSRARPVGAAAPKVAALAPWMMVMPLSLGVALLALGLAHDQPIPKEIEELLGKPGGGLVLLLFVVVLAPLTEEFTFRGWIQRPLERRVGARAAIVLTAFLFALAHLQPDGIPIRMVGGLVLGYVAWATRSIWAGVWLHAAWNAGVVLFAVAFPGFQPAGKGAVVAVPAALVFLVSAAACVRGCRAVRDAARGERRGRVGPPVMREAALSVAPDPASGD